MKSIIMSLVLVLVVVLGISGLSHAGNQNNSSTNASSTSLVTCYQQDGPPFHVTFEVDIWVGGGFDTRIPSDDIPGCAEGEQCVHCLNHLQELGLTIVKAGCGPFNAFGTPFEVCTWTLTGGVTPSLADELPET